MATSAIVVGINEYPPAASQRPLRGAVADAIDFADWALDPAGGGVTPDRLFFWSYPWPVGALPPHLAAYLAGPTPPWLQVDGSIGPPDQTRPPMAQEIIRTAETRGRELFEGKFAAGPNPPKDRILVFLAGHGLRTQQVGESTKQTCFVASNFRPMQSNIADGLVPCASFQQSLRNDRFDEVLLFLDCCRNELAYTSLQALPWCDVRNQRQDLNWSIGYATRDTGVAHETRAAPIRGAFSQTLMLGLRSCRDRHGGLTVDRLDQFVSQNIGRIVQEPQAPYFEYQPRDAPVVIIAGTHGQTVQYQPGPTVEFARCAPGTAFVLKDGNDVPVAIHPPIVAGAAPVALPPLPDGLYSLGPIDAPDLAVLFKQPRDKHVIV